MHGPDPTPSTSTGSCSCRARSTPPTSWTSPRAPRYTEDDKDYTYHRHNPDGTLPSPPTGFPFAPTQPPNAVLAGLNGTTGHFESNQFDWRVVVDYQWTDDFMTYLQASTGYKGGGINPRPFYVSQELSFNPETLTTYEFGFKSDFADNRIRLNVAAFFNKYEDIILRLNRCLQSPVGQQTPCQLPANVGTADVKGVELESNMLLGGGFSVDLSASWLDFKYTETNFAQTGIPTSYITPFTPEKKGSLGIAVGDTSSAATTPSWRAPTGPTSRQVYGDAFNNPYNRIPAYGVGNLRLTWRGPEDQWETSVEVHERHRQALLPGDERLLGVGRFVELRAGTAAHLGDHGEAQLRLIPR